MEEPRKERRKGECLPERRAAERVISLVLRQRLGAHRTFTDSTDSLSLFRQSLHQRGREERREGGRFVVAVGE